MQVVATSASYIALCRGSFRLGRADLALAAFRECRAKRIVPGRRLG